MKVGKFTGIIFPQIELKYFYEDIVGDCVDCRLWAKPVCTAKFRSSTKNGAKDLLFVTHLGLLQPTTSSADGKHAVPHSDP